MPFITGITRNSGGAVLGGCECFLLKYDTPTGIFTQIGASVISNATTGVYTFAGIGDTDPAYCVATFKNGSPDILDVTDRNLTPAPDAGGGWTTPATRGVTAWYDAQDAATLTVVAGPNQVNAWNDKSGHAYHLTNTSVTGKPFYVPGSFQINGHDAVSFQDSASAAMGPPGAYSPTVAAPYLVCAVFTITSAARNAPILGQCSFGNIYAREVSSHTNAIWLQQSSGVFVQVGDQCVVNTPYAFYLLMNGSASRSRLSGNSERSLTLLNDAMTGFNLGIDAATVGNNELRLSANVGELIIIPAATTVDITSFVAYASAHWGITF